MNEFLVVLVFLCATHASEPLALGAVHQDQGPVADDQLKLDVGSSFASENLEGVANLHKVERRARDVVHLLETCTNFGPRIAEEIRNREKLESGQPQEQTTANVVSQENQGTYATIGLESKENRSDNLEVGQPQSAVVVEQHVALQEDLQPPARDVVHILEQHTTIGPNIQNVESTEIKPGNLEVGQPQSAVVLQQHVAVQENLERPVRDVIHLLGQLTTIGPLIKDEDAGKNESDKVVVSQPQSAVVVQQHVASQENLQRPVRDVVHLLGAPTTIGPHIQNVDAKESTTDNVEVVLPQSAVVAQQHVAAPENLERAVRDVVHILGTYTTIGPHIQKVDAKESQTDNVVIGQAQSAVVTQQHVAAQENLQRPVRDVKHILGQLTTIGPKIQNVVTKEIKSDKVVVSQPQSDIVIQQHVASQEKIARPVRDVIHLLGTHTTIGPLLKNVDNKENKSDNVELAEAQSADVAQQHVAEVIENPQERRVRDVIHLLKPQTEELNGDDKLENSVQIQFQESDGAPDASQHNPQANNQHIDFPKSFLGLDVAPPTVDAEKWDHKLQKAEEVQRQVVHSDQPTLQHDAGEYAEPIARQKRALTTLIPNSEEELTKPATLVQQTPQYFAREIIKHAELQDHLQRPARDVEHLPETHATLLSEVNQLKAVVEPVLEDHVERQTRDVSHLAEVQATSSPLLTNQDNQVNKSNEQVERQARDVAHLLGVDTTLGPQNDQTTDKTEIILHQNPQEVQAPSLFPEANSPQDQEERLRRDVIHVVGSSTLKPQTEEEATKVNSHERLKRAVEEEYNKSPPSLSPEDPIGSPPAIFDQLVEDDHYVENIVVQQFTKKATFVKKTKRSVNISPSTSYENVEQIPEYIQKVGKTQLHLVSETGDENQYIKRVTRSRNPEADTPKQAQYHYDSNRRVTRSSALAINDPGEIRNGDHIRRQDSKHGLKTIDKDIDNKRVVRSAEDTSAAAPLEDSTPNPQQADPQVTTEAVEVRELLKPTVKVQHPRLPLTAFAQRNNKIKSTTRRYPDVAVTVPPKGAKRRY